MANSMNGRGEEWAFGHLPSLGSCVHHLCRKEVTEQLGLVTLIGRINNVWLEKFVPVLGDTGLDCSHLAVKLAEVCHQIVTAPTLLTCMRTAAAAVGWLLLQKLVECESSKSLDYHVRTYVAYGRRYVHAVALILHISGHMATCHCPFLPLVQPANCCIALLATYLGGLATYCPIFPQRCSIVEQQKHEQHEQQHEQHHHQHR